MEDMASLQTNTFRKIMLITRGQFRKFLVMKYTWIQEYKSSIDSVKFVFDENLTLNPKTLVADAKL